MPCLWSLHGGHESDLHGDHESTHTEIGMLAGLTAMAMIGLTTAIYRTPVLTLTLMSPIYDITPNPNSAPNPDPDPKPLAGDVTFRMLLDTPVKVA